VCTTFCVRAHKDAEQRRNFPEVHRLLDRVKKLIPYLRAVIVLLITFLFGCGLNTSTQDGKLANYPATVPYGESPTSCFKARVFLGEKPGEIDYFVVCRSHGKRDQPFYGIGRELVSHKASRPGFRRIGLHPRVTDSGAGGPYGECSRFGSGIACSASSTGEVKIEGKFFVSPSKTCTHIVTITAPVVQTCRSQECPAVGGDVVIASGRPDGCS